MGEWENNKLNGFGILFFPNSNVYYEGQWKDGKRSGGGTSIDESGNKYVGEYENDLQSGYGEGTYRNGGSLTIKLGREFGLISKVEVNVAVHF